ncbi:MAG: 50S ribosomal protein L15, partial [Planctomycetota bacterium]
GRGELSFALRVEAHRFEREARRKIQAAGGEAIELKDE